MSELESPTTLEAVIAFMEATTDTEWQTDTVRSADGTKNCFFGHLFNMGSSDEESNRIWDWFENTWATTYAIYSVNDGKHPRYQQATPRARVLAYLRALLSGEEDDVLTACDKEFQLSEAAPSAPSAGKAPRSA